HGARRGGEQVQPERDGRQPESDGARRVVRHERRDPDGQYRQPDRQRQPVHRSEGEQLRGGRRQHEQREDQQRTGDLADLGRTRAEQEQEDRAEGAGRYPVRAGDVRVDGGEQQRPPDDGQHDEGGHRDGGQGGDLAGGDAEEAAEQQRGGTAEEPPVQGHEQHPGREGERLHGTDDGGLLGVPAAALRQGGDDQRGGQAEREVAERDADAEPGRGGGTGEPDDRERVAGEALPAQHHEPAHRGGEDSDDGAGPERVDDAEVRPHVADVGEQVPGESGHG